MQVKCRLGVWHSLVLFVGVFGLGTSVSKAQQIVNGDFEQPGWVNQASSVSSGDDNVVYLGTLTDRGNQTLRGYNVAFVELPGGSTYLEGWKVGGAGVYHHLDNRPWIAWASSGDHCVQMHHWISATDIRGGSVEQEIRGLKPGTNYFLSFDLRQASLSRKSVVTVNLGGSRTVEVLNSAFDVWQTHTIPFVVETNMIQLKFSTPAQTERNIFLDRIRLSTNSNAVVKLEAVAKTGIEVQGRLGSTYRVEWSDRVDGPSWTLLSRVVLTNGPVWVYDDVRGSERGRFYRSVEE